LTQATLTYHDPALAGDLLLRGIDIRGGIGEGSLEVKASDGVWEGVKPLPVGPAAARLTLSPMLDITVDSFEAAIASSRLRAHGTLGRASKPVAKLDLAADLDLADAAWAPAAPPMRGRLSATATVEGEPATLRGKVAVTGTGLDVAGWPLDRVEASVEGNAGKAEATLHSDLLGGSSQSRRFSLAPTSTPGSISRESPSPGSRPAVVHLRWRAPCRER
jgi:autotransporter translocation and assembly factor TamB